MPSLAPLDWLVVAAYFALVFGVATWATRRVRGRQTSTEYFLAGRNTPWFIVGATAFVLVIVCLVIQQIPAFVGVLQVVSLELITSDAYLDADPETVKLNLLLHGAAAQRQNNAYVDRIALCATAGAILFGLEVVTLAVWVLHG